MPLRTHHRRLGAALLALGVALPCALACKDPATRLAEHLASAETYAEQGQPKAALIELQNAMALQPESAEINARMAEVLQQTGETALAAFHFGEVWRLDPDRVDAPIAQARLLRRQQPQRAREVLEAAAERHPEAPELQRAISEEALHRGDVAAGLAAAQRAAELAPDAALSHLQLGLALRAHAESLPGDDPERDATREHALAAFSRAEELAGGHVGARVETAQLLAEIPGREDEAVAAFRAALALCRERDLARRRYVVALSFEQVARRGGDLEQVREALREQVAAEPERLDSWVRLAALSAELDGRAAGDAVFDELLAAWPDAARVWVTVAAELARSGRRRAATSRLEAALEAGLEDPQIREQLVRIDLSAGRVRRARAGADELARLHPDHAIAKRARARVALFEGHLTDALALLAEAEASDPETQLLRAQIELDRGRVHAAGAILQEVLAAGFSEPAKRAEINLRVRSGDWGGALVAVQELAARGYPLGDGERLVRAQALYENGLREAGRRELAALLERKQPLAAAALEFAAREGDRDPEAARAHLEAALARRPGRYVLLEALTHLDLREDRERRAVARLDQALDSGRSGPRTLLLRAELHAAAGRLARAEADAMRALEAAPHLPRALDVAHSIYRAQGREAEVRRSFEEAEARGALDGGARVLLARLQLAAGDSDRARETYRRAIEANPERSAPARNDLAFLLASRGEDLERAQQLALAAQRELPANASVSDTVGYVHLRRGHAEAAADQFRLAIQQADADHGSLPTFHYHLGLAADALGQLPLARHQFERALELDPEFPQAADARRRLAAAERAGATSN